jgi:hypothetical protein
MNIIEFIEAYRNETACRLKFQEVRDKAGVVCKKCSSTEHYWLWSKEMYQCKKCRFRTSLRSGTIMEASKLSFQYWFIAMYLMSCTKKSISVYELQRQLGHKRYEPIWAMMHKIRSAMGTRDNKYLLKGNVEVDEGFFETIVPEREKDEPRKRGRGSQKQTMAMVFAESEQVKKPKKNKPSTRCKYFKMVVTNTFDAKTAKGIINKHIQKNSTMISDGYKTYKALEKEFENLITQKIPSKEAHIKLPWVHTAIGNVKKVLQGIFHRINPEFLQNYLDEFCFKLNRRYFGLNIFDRTLIACTLT